VKATVPERTGRQGPPRQSRPAKGMERPVRLRLVADHGRLLPQQQAVLRQAVPRQEPQRQAVPERTPIRLTRRGRVVATAAVVMLVGAASLALVLWMPMR
jgi:hypothetical protein